MIKRVVIAPLAAILLAVSPGVVSSAVASDESPEYGYACENCPTNWGNPVNAQDELEFAACVDGTAQSPIAFDRGTAKRTNLSSLRPRFGDSVLEVERLAVNFEAFVESGSSYSRIGGKRYELLQFHFHSKSEHMVDGERYPLEMHFVHKASDGSVAVIGLFIEEGEALDEIEPLINALPAVQAASEGGKIEVEAIDVGELLPSSRSSYRYTGSTTTPPCTGDVSWILLNQTVEMSAAQIAAIQSAIRSFNVYGDNTFDNNRPIQERNGRVVKTDVSGDDDDDNDDDD